LTLEEPSEKFLQATGASVKSRNIIDQLIYEFVDAFVGYLEGYLEASFAATAFFEDVNLLYQRGLRQVYASGVGLVLRRRFNYNTFTTNADGSQTLTPGVVQSGQARRETLIESGTL
jgi:translation initiation factor IF-2